MQPRFIQKHIHTVATVAANFWNHYNQQSKLIFTYEEKYYFITIAEVVACPQCYSIIAARLRDIKGDYLIVDIGSKTTNIVYVQNGFPVENKSITIEKTTVKWMKGVQHNIMDDKNDRELYLSLIIEAGNSAYLTIYTNRVLEEHFILNLEIADRQKFYNQIFSVVREKCSYRG